MAVVAAAAAEVEVEVEVEAFGGRPTGAPGTRGFEGPAPAFFASAALRKAAVPSRSAQSEEPGREMTDHLART